MAAFTAAGLGWRAMQATIRTLLERVPRRGPSSAARPTRAATATASPGCCSRSGKRMIPVNPPPRRRSTASAPIASLHDLPDDVRVDVVDIFRRSSEAGAHVDEAIAIGARAVWLQLGVDRRGGRAARAVDAGLLVVMDRCPAIEWRRLAGVGHHVTHGAASAPRPRSRRGRPATRSATSARAASACAADGARTPSENLAEGVALARARARVLRRGVARAQAVSAPLDPVPLLRGAVGGGRASTWSIGGFAVDRARRRPRDEGPRHLSRPGPRATSSGSARCSRDLEVVQVGVGGLRRGRDAVRSRRAPRISRRAATSACRRRSAILDVMQWLSGIDGEQRVSACCRGDAVDAERRRLCR